MRPHTHTDTHTHTHTHTDTYTLEKKLPLKQTFIFNNPHKPLFGYANKATAASETLDSDTHTHTYTLTLTKYLLCTFTTHRIKISHIFTETYPHTHTR